MLANDEPAVWREAVDSFFERSSDFDLCISPIVVEEIYRVPDDFRKVIIDKIVSVNPEYLIRNADITALADEYVNRGIFTPKYLYDGLHVAFASYYGVDILVSFNYRHLVRYENKRLIHATNIVLGYSTPSIISPEEV